MMVENLRNDPAFLYNIRRLPARFAFRVAQPLDEALPNTIHNAALAERLDGKHLAPHLFQPTRELAFH